MSIRVAAKIAGVSPSTIQRDLTARNQPDTDGMIRLGWTMGLDGKVRPDRRFDTSDRDAQIVEMHNDGKSIRQIATALGCSVGTVHRIISKVPRRGLRLVSG